MRIFGMEDGKWVYPEPTKGLKDGQEAKDMTKTSESHGELLITFQDFENLLISLCLTIIFS